MGGIEAIYQKLKVLFPEALDIGTDNLIQGGVFLLFRGSKPLSYKRDVCHFSLLVAGRSLVEDKNAIFPVLDELRERIIDSGMQLFGKDIYRGVNSGEFEDSLYVYSIELEIEFFSNFQTFVEKES